MLPCESSVTKADLLATAASSFPYFRPGLVIAVEPMVNLGRKDVKVHRDQWTQVTADGKPSAHFEHTVALTKDGPLRLTAGPGEERT